MKKFLSKIRQMSVSSWILFVVLAFYAATMLFMYGWGFFTSLKSNSQFVADRIGMVKGWPWEWQWSNYIEAFDAFTINKGMYNEKNFFEMLTNSLIYSLMRPLITTFCTWCMAYICARFQTKVAKFLFNLNMVFMMIPVVGSLPSQLQIYTAIGLYDTWAFVAIAAIAWTGQNYIIFYAFLRGVSNELCEAAEIDGAGNWRVMLSIVFPLSINMFGILFLMSFINCWNNYMTMVIWLPSYPSLAYGMYMFTSNTSGLMPPKYIAGSMIVMFPLLVLFFVFREKIIGGVTVSSFK